MKRILFYLRIKELTKSFAYPFGSTCLIVITDSRSPHSNSWISLWVAIVFQTFCRRALYCMELVMAGCHDVVKLSKYIDVFVSQEIIMEINNWELSILHGLLEISWTFICKAACWPMALTGQQAGYVRLNSHIYWIIRIFINSDCTYWRCSC